MNDTSTFKVGNLGYRLETTESDGQWTACAYAIETGDRFGPSLSGKTADEAAARMRAWFEWQDAHQTALEAVQAAERAYQRIIAGSVFADPVEGPSAIEMQKDALKALREARLRLDAIRHRKPD